ncbi:MAG: hypothetical protein LBE27_03280, partial [Deltaproteobacteria bacterium]|nr:hypothetical protein [Deltaproteobacteria bacterium]
QFIERKTENKRDNSFSLLAWATMPRCRDHKGARPQGHKAISQDAVRLQGYKANRPQGHISNRELVRLATDWQMPKLNV